MSRYLKTMICLSAFAAMTLPAQADYQTKSLIELFTSQGCSSCPPADKLMKVYDQRADVIPITLNVDYWDYLGWKDTLAKREYSDRQRLYARRRGDGQVYTPQVVVNGMAHAVGSRKTQINGRIENSLKRLAGRRVGIELVDNKSHVLIRLSEAANPARIRNAIVWVARVEREVPIPIEHGENAGHKITYYNVARSLEAVAMYDGTATELKLPKHRLLNSANSGCVVFVQLGKGGPVIGAAELKKWGGNS